MTAPAGGKHRKTKLLRNSEIHTIQLYTNKPHPWESATMVISSIAMHTSLPAFSCCWHLYLQGTKNVFVEPWGHVNVAHASLQGADGRQDEGALQKPVCPGTRMQESECMSLVRILPPYPSCLSGRRTLLLLLLLLLIFIRTRRACNMFYLIMTEHGKNLKYLRHDNLKSTT